MSTYDPTRVVVTFQGQQIIGFAEGTFVTAEFDEDSFTKAVGSDGRVIRSRNPNTSGSVTVTLMADSPSNDILSAAARQDRTLGTGFGALSITDANGTTLVTAPSAWVRKLPAATFGKEASDANREWVFDVASMDVHIGGMSTLP
jgi:hypothetical protein